MVINTMIINTNQYRNYIVDDRLFVQKSKLSRAIRNKIKRNFLNYLSKRIKNGTSSTIAIKAVTCVYEFKIAASAK